MRIDLEYQIDNLSKRQYIFWFDESRSALWVDEYNIIKRDSQRHKYKIVEQYKRISHRADLNNIKMEDIPLDEEIKQAALNELISRVKVDFWVRS